MTEKGFGWLKRGGGLRRRRGDAGTRDQDNEKFRAHQATIVYHRCAGSGVRYATHRGGREIMSFGSRCVGIALAMLSMACGGGNTPPQGEQTAPGSDRTAKTAALETGASLIQHKEPLDQIAMYLVGFHPSKDDPSMQMESHHYCNQVNQDFAQCVLFDGNTAEARLHGIEFIISESLYATLPAEERAYWHPHNYEILSGQLRLPGLPDVAEKQALATKINSYGKTWHVWKSGVFNHAPDALPLGPAQLAWSFNYDGEALPGMVEERDRRMGQNSAEARASRADLAAAARPQGGVDAIKDRLPGTGTVNGVRDNGDQATKPIPAFTLQPPR